MRRHSLTLLFALGLLPAIAWAEPTTAEITLARRLFSEAVAAESVNEWELAADKLRQAIAIKETPGLRFHLAYCEEQLGRLVEALAEYDRAEELVRLEPKAARDVQKQLGPRRAALRRRVPTTTLLLPEGVPFAKLELDGLAMPPELFGKPIPLNPGLHTIVVSAEGREAFTREITLAEGDANVTTVSLPAASAHGAAVATGVDPARAQTEGSADGAAVASGSGIRNWVLLGEGVIATAALGVGIGYTVAAGASDDRADKARSELSATSGSENAKCGAPKSTSQRICDDLARAVGDGKSQRKVATIAFVGAGASAAALVGTWLLWPSRKATSGTALHIQPVATARGDASFVLSGSF